MHRRLSIIAKHYKNDCSDMKTVRQQKNNFVAERKMSPSVPSINVTMESSQDTRNNSREIKVKSIRTDDIRRTLSTVANHCTHHCTGMKSEMQHADMDRKAMTNPDSSSIVTRRDLGGSYHQIREDTQFQLSSRQEPMGLLHELHTHSQTKIGSRSFELVKHTTGDALPQAPIGLLHELQSFSKSRITSREFEFDPRKGSGTSIYPTIIGVAFGFVVLCVLLSISKAKRKKQKESSNKIFLLEVFKYLLAFDFEDVDMRVSPSGGILVGYRNDLAEGKNNKTKDLEDGDDDPFYKKGLSARV